MLTSIFILVIGFVALIKGADYFVDSSSSIAKKLRIPPMIIGLTLVGLGTSLPELAVSTTSALQGMTDMSISNVTGSNVMNILLVLGLSSCIRVLPIDKRTVTNDLSMLLLASIVLAVASYIGGSVSLLDGVLMLSMYAWYLYRLIKEAKANPTPNIDNGDGSTPGFIKILFFLVLGAVGIILGGNLVVDSATEIAKVLGMSTGLAGLVITAVGTSLPELVTSVVATKKGEVNLAIGNVVGSNTLNILVILGISSCLTPLAVTSVSFIDIVFCIFTTALLASISARYKKLGKVSGILFMVIYFSYLVFAFLR